MKVQYSCNLDRFKSKVISITSREYDFRPIVGDLVVVDNTELEVVAIRYNLDGKIMSAELHIPKKFLGNEDFIKKVYF